MIKIIEEYKPKLLVALANVKKVAIKVGNEFLKQIVIEINGAVVKILVDGISGGEVGTSDGASYAFDSEVHDIWVEIDDSVQTYNYMSISDSKC